MCRILISESGLVKFMVLYKFIFILTEARCGLLPLVLNSKPEPYTTDVGHIVNIHCDAGHKFPDDSTMVSLHCSSKKKWNSTNLSHCQGEV